MSPVLPPAEPEEELEGSTVYLPASIWRELVAISKASSKRFSRNDVILHMLRYALEAYRKEQEEKKSRGK